MNDVASLERELQELRKQKFETKERLDASRGQRGGRGGGFQGQGRGAGFPHHTQPDFPPRGDGFKPRGGYYEGRGGHGGRGGGFPGGRGRGMMGERGPAGGRGFPGPPPALAARLGGMRGGPGSHRDFPGPPPHAMGYSNGPQHDMHSGAPPPPRRGRPPSDHDDRDAGPRQFNSNGGGPRTRRDDIPLEAPLAAPRKRLISSVVVKDKPKDEDSMHDSEKPEQPSSARGVKRGAPDDDDMQDAHAERGESQERGAQPAAANGAAAGGARKRNRRMFGALLGTLAKFREEDATFQASDVATRRIEAQKKAEEREKQQSEALRQREYQARAEKREEELSKLSEISLATDTKMLELIFFKRIAHKQALSNFLCTTASPPLHWMPAMPCPETDALMQQQREKMEEWKAATLEELETEKAGLKKRSEERKAGALARRAERLAIAVARRGEAGAVGAAAGGAGDQADEDADMADQRELAAGEFNAGHGQQQQDGEAMDEGKGGTQQQGQRAANGSDRKGKRGGNKMEVDEERYQGGHEHDEDEEGEKIDDDKKEGDDDGMGEEDMHAMRDREAATVEDLLS